MSDSISGYFEYELLSGSFNKKNSVYSSGRTALAALLKYSNVDKLYVSEYTCDAVLEPLLSLGISFEFYKIDKRLLPSVNFNIEANSAILVNNYFGLLDYEIARMMNFKTYLNAIGGKQFIGSEIFFNSGIELGFVHPKLGLDNLIPVGFEKGMSIIDVLAFYGKKIHNDC